MPPSAKRWTRLCILPIPIMLELNENTNGLIRQYVPKGTALDTLSQAQGHHIMERLNHRRERDWHFKRPMKSYARRFEIAQLNAG